MMQTSEIQSSPFGIFCNCIPPMVHSTQRHHKLTTMRAFLLLSLLSASSSFTLTPSSRLASSLAAKKVFIDGEAGTTGLQVRDRLADREDLEILSAPADLRKDEATRKKLINEADAVILCECGSCWIGGFSLWLIPSACHSQRP